MTKPKNILVAPLNWGLGHATRCIPIIKKLQQNGFTPILASDGNSLALLKKEFPNLEHILLPSYNIKYAKKGYFFKLKLFLNLPQIIAAVQQEKKLIDKIIFNKNIDGIISDNRFGVYHKSTPSIYITHQINVLSGITTILSSKLHRHIIKKFDECWIPDHIGNNNYSGKLSRTTETNLNLKYIGNLSRFKQIKTITKYDYLILLSGPEPQRSLLEQKLFIEFSNTSKKVLFIRGIVKPKQEITVKENITSYNYMTSSELETAISESKLIITRSGYTTIMDLAKMNKTAFFIPTPGQTEQLYLAKRLEKLNYTPFCHQKDFSLDKLTNIDNYKGLHSTKDKIDISNLFTIFN